MKLLFIIIINLILLAPFLPSNHAFAQDNANDIFAADDDDLNIGGDIFTDFNEDVENTKLVEDERFYRYGRFFSFNASIGLTTFVTLLFWRRKLLPFSFLCSAWRCSFGCRDACHPWSPP